MAFNIQYNVIATDKFTGAASSINRSAEKMKSTFAGLATKLDRANQKIGAFGAGMRRVGRDVTVFGSLPVGLMGANMIKAASDAEEAGSKFDAVFQGIGGEADKTAENLGRNFGLATTKAKELLGNTGDLLTGFGFTQDSALDLSKRVNELAVDLASFTNFSGGAEGASAALTKSLLGERESVKSLGVSILEEDVKRKVQILRAKGMRFETERQAKAYATLEMATEQSKNAIGYFARTQNSFASQSQILSAALQDLNEEFGSVMLPLATKAIVFFRDLIRQIGDFSPMMKKVILGIGGFVFVAGPMLLALGQMIIAFTLLQRIGAVTVLLKKLAKAVAAARSVMLLFNLAMVANPIGAIISAISVGIGLIIAFRKEFNNLINTVLRFVLPAPLEKLFGLMASGAKISTEGQTINQSSPSLSPTVENISRIEGVLNIANAPAGSSLQVKKTNAPNVNIGMNMATAGAM